MIGMNGSDEHLDSLRPTEEEVAALRSRLERAEGLLRRARLSLGEYVHKVDLSAHDSYCTCGMCDAWKSIGDIDNFLTPTPPEPPREDR